MNISDEGLDLIKQFEGLVLQTYKCPAGVYTIGYGSTGPHVKPEMVITEKKALALLKADVARFEAAVNRLVQVPITQGQYDALVSFSFNCGEAALKRSSLLKLINAGERDPKLIEAKFMLWCKAGGKTNQGLRLRRKREANLFNSGR